LKSNFSDIQSISAYGGETLEPPVFGKVFISVDIYNADGTPQNRINTFSNFIKDKTPVSIDVVFVDPQFMYAEVVTNVKYNVNATSKLPSDIQALVAAQISQFNLDNLDGFNKTLYFSKLSEAIDAADPSIVSNNTDITAVFYTPVKNGVVANLTLDYGFEILQETGVTLSIPEVHFGHNVWSSPFTYFGNRAIIVDDSVGGLFVAKYTGNGIEIVKQIGTVDYTKGILTVNSVEVEATEHSIGLEFYVRSKDKDFASTKNKILKIREDQIEVTVTPVKL
jgi:hypothetical protein